MCSLLFRYRLVITRLPVPVPATATNLVSAEDQHSENQALLSGTSRADHAPPLSLVITRLLLPVPDTATNSPRSAAHVTENQLLSLTAVVELQLTPFELVSTLFPAPAPVPTATNNPFSSDQHTENRVSVVAPGTAAQDMPSALAAIRTVPLSPTETSLPSEADQATDLKPPAGVVLIAQLMPSSLVMTPVVLALADTATNRPSSFAHITQCQKLFAALVRLTQLTPSALVMTRLPVPLEDTATNKPRSADQQTLLHWFVLGVVLIAQLTPSSLVMTPVVLALVDTATNRPSSSDQQDEYQLLSAALARVVQTIPIFGSSAGDTAIRICAATIPGIIRPPSGR